MISKYNHCTFEGNCGRDPDVRERITSFSLAVYQGKDRPTLWLHVKCFDMRVDVSKGQKVKVQGRLYFENYTGKDGLQKSVFGVIADTVEPLERAEKEEKPQQRPAYTPPEDQDCPF